jgi:hypothetical protein
MRGLGVRERVREKARREEMVRRICDDSRLTMDRESEASVTGPVESGHAGCLTVAAQGLRTAT